MSQWIVLVLNDLQEVIPHSDWPKKLKLLIMRQPLGFGSQRYFHGHIVDILYC